MSNQSPARATGLARPAAVARLAAALLLGLGVLVAPGRGTMAALARTPDCPAPPITFEQISRVSEAGDALACFGGRLLTLRAYVPRPTEGWGGTSAGVIAPRWLNGFAYRWVLLAADAKSSSGMGVFVPPALGRCDTSRALATCPFRWYYGRWVTVSLHFDGPAAQTCRYTAHPRGPGFTRHDAVEYCRTLPILLSVGPVAPPATATLSAPSGDRQDPATAPLLGATFALAVVMLIRRRRSRRVAA